MKLDFDKFDISITDSGKAPFETKVVTCAFDVEDFDGTVMIQVKLQKVFDFIVDEELNVLYIDEDTTRAVNVESFFFENQKDIMQKYITNIFS